MGIWVEVGHGICVETANGKLSKEMVQRGVKPLYPKAAGEGVEPFDPFWPFRGMRVTEQVNHRHFGPSWPGRAIAWVVVWVVKKLMARAARLDKSEPVV